MGGLFLAGLLALHLGHLAHATCPSWDRGHNATCTCEEAKDLYTACLNCTPSAACQCTSSSSQGRLNLTDFYAQECHGSATRAALYVAIILPPVALLLAALLVYAFVQRRKVASLGHDKRASKASDAGLGQPRYISHTSPLGDAARSPPGHQEYENVFVDQPQGARGGRSERRSRKPSKSRPPSKVRDTDSTQNDQPIYANTQDVYYNYVGRPATQEVHNEGVYVIPDQ
ncbi:uncharacterized protein LOC140701663 [Pogona vitticeps]